MRLVEFEVSSVNTEKLAALSQFLLSRTEDTNAKKTMPVSSFLDLANNMGVGITDDQLRNLVQQPPLSEIIANIEGDAETGTITFKGAEEVAPNMSVDQARDTVDTMAKRALNKKGL
jgi:hypothetical protein